MTRPVINSPSLGWRSFDLTWPDLATNLAGDEAILVEAEERGAPPTLRFWELAHPAVVLGASCRLKENVHVDACRADEVPLGRRSSGGGTVVIGPGALNVTIVLPIATESAFRSVDTAQRFILDQIAEALRVVVPGVAMLGSGDLTLGGRKFSGSAQRRLRHFLMVHASILYDFDLDLISRYTKLPPRQPSYRDNRSHADFVINLPMMRTAIVRTIQSIWREEPSKLADWPMPVDLVADLSFKKFGDNSWIERL